MSGPKASSATRRFDPLALARALPEQATTLLVDTYLVDRPTASARVFRVYRGTPPHYHATCDEFLYVLSGRGTFWVGDAAAVAPFAPTFLSLDTPRRDPTDIVFVNTGDGTPATFMGRNADG